MKDAQPVAIQLKDYQEPNFWIEKTDLSFQLYDDYAQVESRLAIVRNPSQGSDAPLVLHGQNMELLALAIDGKPLVESEYSVDADTLTIPSVGKAFELSCVNRIEPQNNTSLEGLYRSRTMFCTQCEAEGFRKITYYLDRPDVMSEFTTRIEADKQKYPVLLSNGNPTQQGDAENGRHWVEWHDPFKKPAYLFALVAGDLCNIDDSFVTKSGREVLLRIFVEEKDTDKVAHAMTSLKKSMKWDEDVYGREYDLDIFMIVAVDDFNMGAMENKGLNIFNTSCVLANKDTTTDAAFQRVEAVVAHEYFHNWSGNRVTCRDWFQLSLKEGFTVFRDSEFSADMNSATVKRVEDVSLLRTLQFAEDSGPMAHPVQPASFIEISNFYTLTIYEKGAEVVRMIHTLLGEDIFRQGSDLYFERHDGQAVTIDDFIAAMAEVSGRDFTQFMNWYRQAGTPVVTMTSDYNADEKTYTLRAKQHCPPTPENTDKKPYLIPLRVGLVGEAGELPLSLRGAPVNPERSDNTSVVLDFTEETQEFVFDKIEEEPVPSLLRGFSAPVKLHYNYSRDALARLMRADSDGFCRWDASQQFAVHVIHDVMAALANEPAPQVDARFIEACSSVVNNQQLDPAMLALMLQLPSEDYLAEQAKQIDVESIHYARNRVKRKLAVSLYDDFLGVYKRMQSSEQYSPDAQSIARRSLKNLALHYLVQSGKEQGLSLAKQQYDTADNMTDSMAALNCIVHAGSTSSLALAQACLDDFYARWKDEALVVNQWFGVQASNPRPGTIKVVEQLMQHPAFDFTNPNKLRALVGGFAMRNPINFHERSGSGYGFLADQIIRLDKQNPQIAARLLTPLTKWRKYDDQRQSLMKGQLERIKSESKLSPDVYEVVSKSLT